MREPTPDPAQWSRTRHAPDGDGLGAATRPSSRGSSWETTRDASPRPWTRCDGTREIRGEVAELAAAFSPASWLTEWEKNPYALDPFIDQLRQLRARPARQLAARQKRMQEEMESVKESCEQTLAARPVTRAAPAHGDGDGAGRAC